MRAFRRESLRATLFLCRRPRLAPRCNSGWAARRASPAAALSPLAIAASTLRTNFRMRPRREWLTAACRALRRMRFLADLCCAMTAGCACRAAEGRVIEARIRVVKTRLARGRQRFLKLGSRFSPKAAMPSF